MSTNYPDTHLFLNGEWREAAAKESLEIINPATEEVIGKPKMQKGRDHKPKMIGRYKLKAITGVKFGG